MPIDILATLEGKWEDGSRPRDLYAAHVAKRPRAFVATLLEGLASKQKRVQGGCAELCSLVSEEFPELLYPHLDLFAQNLHAKEPVLRWEAACTLGNLAPADAKKRLPALVPALADLLGHESIVLQGHAAKALARIARAHPGEAERVFRALAGSSHFFAGTRVGYLVEAMEAFAGKPALAARVRAFLEPYARSEHAPVARKARRAIKMIG